MNELEQKIHKKPFQTENNVLMADDDIKAANNLFIKKENKVKLTAKEISRLEKLTAKIESELDKYFPDFKFSLINRFRGENETLTEEQRKESDRNYELAKKYFEELAELTPTELYNRVLYREKLINREKDTSRLEISFRNEYEKKKNEFEKLNTDIELANRKGHFINSYIWKKFIKKSESGNISNSDIEEFTDKIDNERLIIQYINPDYFKEAVLYVPGLAQEAKRRVVHNYFLKGKQRTRTEARYKTVLERITVFDKLKITMANKQINMDKAKIVELTV